MRQRRTVYFFAEYEKVNTAECLNNVGEGGDFERWHSRFGHLNSRDLNSLSSKGMVRGLDLKMPKDFKCMTCAVGKISTKSFPSYSQVNTKAVLELVHTDLCGPFRVRSQGGALYLMTITDDYSRFIFTYFLKNKCDAFEVFKLFTAMAEKQSGRKSMKVRSDNGKEYLNSRFKEFFEKNGVLHQTTISHTPQQNGVAERANRTLIEMARCMLHESGLPPSLWAEAVNTAAYIRNRSPTKVLGEVTPYEKWYSKKPSVAHFKTFGCDAVVLQKQRTGGKLEPKGLKMKFVGYENFSKGYRLFNTERREIVKARDVIFFESSFENAESTSKTVDELNVNIFYPANEIDGGDASNDVATDDVQQDDNFETASEEETQYESETEIEQSDAGGTQSNETQLKRGRGRPKLIRTKMKGRPRKVYVTDRELLNTIVEDPQTLKEALKSDEADEWKKAMNAEYQSIIKNKTWDLVDRPKSGNIIGSKWVFSIKRRADGTVERYKARLVAQGCSQRYQVDYHETFAPVVRHSTIRIVLALAVQHELLIHHIDIVAAYLNGDLEDDVYMEQPPMFKDPNNERKVCKLKKALYGLRQAGREWNRKVTEIILSMNFQRCQTDNCVYFQRDGDCIVIIALYVDDMILAASTKEKINEIITKLNNEVEADDRGPISFYLGMQIERDGERGSIRIHQEEYTKQLLQNWGMQNSKPVSTPWANGTTLSKCEGDGCEYNMREYQSLIGSLMYLAVISRPDISHVVSRLSQFNSHPHAEHMQAAKYLLRYLVKHPGGKITYTKNGQNVFCFTDADWGCDSCDRRSFSGFVMFLTNGAVAWESRKQSVVALSSMEAEYVALCQGAKEVIFTRSLLREMGFAEYVREPTSIYCDNQGANFMVRNPAVHKRSKHIDIKYHYIRDKYNEGSVDVEYIPSEENAADIFTKVLMKQKHVVACELLKLEL